MADLKPDLILTQDLCSVCAIDADRVRAIAERLPGSPAVLSLNPHTILDVFEDVLRVGEAVGRADAARATVVRLREKYWSAIDYVTPYLNSQSVLFLEWTDPTFVGGHWTPGLIHAAGAAHPLNGDGCASRIATAEEIIESAPERIIICPCGIDLAGARRCAEALSKQKWWQMLPAVMDDTDETDKPSAINALMQARVVLVDGSAMFNRPGPRLVDAFCFLVAWLQGRPEVLPPRFPAEPWTSLSP